MKVRDLWWECPKCKSKVSFGEDLTTLFCDEDNEAYFCPESGVPFYLVCCDNNDCDASWNFGISGMFE
jgi:hypothetical protein